MLRVKDICKDKNISLGDLAKKLKISRTALTNQIQGNPTLDSMQRIAKELQCCVFELIEPESGYYHVYHNNEYKGLTKM